MILLEVGMRTFYLLLLIALVSLLMVGYLGCGAAVPLDGFADGQTSVDKAADAARKGQGGGQFQDIHDQHSGISCLSCHGMHFGVMPDRETCLSCHPEQQTNHSSRDCTDCHNGSGQPGNGGPT
jgi:hypothetical protein